MASSRKKGSPVMNDVAERVGHALGTATGTTERLVAQTQDAAVTVKDTVVANAAMVPDLLHEAQAQGAAIAKDVRRTVTTARARTKRVIAKVGARAAQANRQARRVVKKATRAATGARKTAKTAVATLGRRGRKIAKNAKKKTRR